MVNPLVLLPILSASNLNTTTNGCYKQNPRGQPQRVSTTFTVCNQAINRIAAGRALDVPLDFGRLVKVGEKLPDQFTMKGLYGTCVIHIDMKEGKQDTLTWRDIIVGASELRDMCVAAPPHLGGEANVGPRQLLEMKLYGLDDGAELALPEGSSGQVWGRQFDA